MKRIVLAASAALLLASGAQAQVCRTNTVLGTVFCDSAPKVLEGSASSVSGQATIAVTGQVVVPLSLTADTALTIGSPSGKTAQLAVYLFQGGAGGSAPTFPAAVQWPNGVPPSFNRKLGCYDLVQLITTDGGATWTGMLAVSAATL